MTKPLVVGPLAGDRVRLEPLRADHVEPLLAAATEARDTFGFTTVLCRRYSNQPFFEPVEHVDEPLEIAMARLRRVWTAVDHLVARSDLESTFEHEDGTKMNLRWVIAHLVEEIARHAGHADILRELIDGSTGR